MCKTVFMRLDEISEISPQCFPVVWEVSIHSKLLQGAIRFSSLEV